MIESNIIEWLDFGESIQKIDVYSKINILNIFRLYRELLKNKFPILLDILLMILSFSQILCLTSFFVSKEGEIIIEIFNYLKNVFILSNIINNKNFVTFFSIMSLMIFVDIILTLIIFFSSKNIKLDIFTYIVNLINILIFYYLLGPAIEIFLTSFLCSSDKAEYLRENCFSKSKHIIYIIFSILVCFFYIIAAVFYSLFFNEIGSIETKSGKLTRINVNYELFFILGKCIIFFFYFIIKNKINHYVIKLIYLATIFFISVLLCIYVIKNVYYYNIEINYIVNIGWFVCSWYSFCIFIKMMLIINNISNFIMIGWIIIIILFCKAYKIKEISLITDSDIFEFKDIKTIEMHNNALLNELSNKRKFSSKLLLYGIIKKFEECIDNNPEVNYHYYKLLNDKYLNKKYNKEIDLRILSIIYILYTIQLEKSSFKEEIALYMCYFLINNFNNPIYAIFLSSRIKARGLGIFYKYLLVEEIKGVLTYKLNNKNKESIRHVQIGSIILYYLYMDLLKVKIYDGLTNQIDYFDILKNNATSSKTSSNFMKAGKNILKIRKEILSIWEKIIELNPFSDESYKDYNLYLNSILQDEILSREECKRYSLLKTNKSEERFNTYHSMFLIDKSSILLIDGYFSIGKILYASPNISNIFSYNSKELINLSIDDIIPNGIQSFHKELIEETIKYSNLNYKFKRQINSLIKNKDEGLINITLFIKAVPNIKFGLIFLAYLQKRKKANFVIILDKDLKMNGFTETSIDGSPFTYETGYNLSYSLYGYHIGLIIPDILPLLEYKNEEFDISKKDLELKGYLYQVNNKKEEIKVKVDNILNKIKINSNKNNVEMQYEEDSLQKISEEFNELIAEINKQKLKPYSIFYKVQVFSFLDNKHKYFRISISDDIITGNEKEQIIKKEIEESKFYKNSSNIFKKNNISKNSIEINKKINKGVIKKTINIEKQTLNDNNNEYNYYNEQNSNEIKDILEPNKNLEYSEGKEKNKLKKKNNKNKSSIGSKQFISYSDYNKIKLCIFNKKDGTTIKIMKIVCLFFLIANLLFIFLDNKTIKKYFIDLSLYFESNLVFVMAKMSIGVIYIMTENIKWEIHNCLWAEHNVNYTAVYENIIKSNIQYLLKIKNTTNNIGPEFQDIVSKRHIIYLSLYGKDTKESYNLNLDNILLYIINEGLNVIESHAYLLAEANKSNNNISPLTFGYNELFNLENLSYLYFISDINGFTEEEKKKRIQKVSNILPLISNSIILFIIIIFYIISIIKLYRKEIFFLEKLINFNSTNFDEYLKNLDEIKKKLQNDNINEEEEKDDIDIIDLESKKNSKEENELKENKSKSKNNSQKKSKQVKKNEQNKIGKMIKQRKNKFKIMSSFFIKINIFFVARILLIMIVSLSYYIISLLIEISKKNEFSYFDKLNNDIFEVFKESFDIFILFKKELEKFENNLEKCEVRNKDLYKLNISSLENIKNPNFGDSIIQISTDFDFKGKNLEKFNIFFNENACKILAKTPTENLACNYFNDFLFHGMEQCVSKITSLFGTIIEELESINTDGSQFKVIFNKSSFHEFEIFIEYYYEKAIFIIEEIFQDLRAEELNKILHAIKIVEIVYIIATFFSFMILTYLVYSLHNIVNTFLNFIGILPFKYLSEDEKFYKEVIVFGNQYFGSN